MSVVERYAKIRESVEEYETNLKNTHSLKRSELFQPGTSGVTPFMHGIFRCDRIILKRVAQELRRVARRNQGLAENFFAHEDDEGNSIWVYAIFSDDPHILDSILSLYKLHCTGHICTELRMPRRNKTITLLHCLSYTENLRFTNNKYSKYIDFFVENGLDLMQLSGNGYTVLHLCVGFNNSTLLQTILQRKEVEVNARNYRGGTALLETVEQYGFAKFKDTPRVECARLLLDYGGDPNLPDNAGFTPLQYSLKCDVYGEEPIIVDKIIYMLVDSGARIFSSVSDLYCPFALALTCDAPEILNLFLHWNRNHLKLKEEEWMGDETDPFPLSTVIHCFIANDLEKGNFRTKSFWVLMKYGATFYVDWLYQYIDRYKERELAEQKRIDLLFLFFLNNYFKHFLDESKKNPGISFVVLNNGVRKHLRWIRNAFFREGAWNDLLSERYDFSILFKRRTIELEVDPDFEVICTFCREFVVPGETFKTNESADMAICSKCYFLEFQEDRKILSLVDFAERRKEKEILNFTDQPSEVYLDAGLNSYYLLEKLSNLEDSYQTIFKDIEAQVCSTGER
eukprot:augustus_masked-scaffold_2-processed-gene-7.13-mRNA-1 protein AED:1.00 eAED:1.00 QI:0/-1/0/0/-1/1/1/0/568